VKSNGTEKSIPQSSDWFGGLSNRAPLQDASLEKGGAVQEYRCFLSWLIGVGLGGFAICLAVGAKSIDGHPWLIVAIAFGLLGLVAAHLREK
jgi:hypothetical protein